MTTRPAPDHGPLAGRAPRAGAPGGSQQPSTWTRVLTSSGSAPLVCGVLVALNGLYIGLVAFGNITDFQSNRAFVHHVLAMDTTNFGQPEGVGLDPAVMWRAITTPWLQDVAYVAVIVWETLATIALTGAVVLSVRGRHARERARVWATVGLSMIVVLFAGGFIAIGGEWFAMYRSTQWNGLDPAFRNSVLALLTIVLIRQPTSQHSPPGCAEPGSADRPGAV